MGTRITFYLLLFILLPKPGFCQDPNFESIYRSGINELARFEKSLNKLQGEKRLGIRRLYAINARINKRQELVERIRKEQSFLQDRISDTKSVQSALDRDLSILRTEYEHMLFSLQKSTLIESDWLLLLSGNSLKQVINRYGYLQQYRKSRNQQVKKIKEVDRQLTRNRYYLDNQQLLLDSVLQYQEEQFAKLKELWVEQKSSVDNLRYKETEIRNSVNKKKKELAGMEALLKDYINDGTEVTVTKTKKSFASRQGRLEWPVRGLVIKKFGMQPHPVLKNLYETNLGVDISGESGEPVHVVYEGTVKAIADIPGSGKMVMVQHGEEYFTVYSKLEAVWIQQGDQLTVGDAIGKLKVTDQEIAELQFQIWKNQEKLDPELWLDIRK